MGKSRNKESVLAEGQKPTFLNPPTLDFPFDTVQDLNWKKDLAESL